MTRLMAGELADLTTVPGPGRIALISPVDEIVARQIGGAFVECGVWRGGASILAALRFRSHGQLRPIWLFDSFEGLPPPREIDGPAAAAWASDPHGSNYKDNFAADEGEVLDALARFDVDAHVVKGWFDDTLPVERDRLAPIALLRIDGDWYDSVLCCLTNLYDKVAPGGWVILDDYYYWDGCALAVHEFLARRKLPHRIVTAGPTAYFVKSGPIQHG
jgi:O-methyltransferase